MHKMHILMFESWSRRKQKEAEEEEEEEGRAGPASVHPFVIVFFNQILDQQIRSNSKSIYK